MGFARAKNVDMCAGDVCASAFRTDARSHYERGNRGVGLITDAVSFLLVLISRVGPYLRPGRVIASLSERSFPQIRAITGAGVVSDSS